jgi:GTP-binding protein Era
VASLPLKYKDYNLVFVSFDALQAAHVSSLGYFRKVTPTIDEMAQRKGQNMTDIHANIIVERDSQKGIIIGHRGSRLKDVGQRARLEIEKLVGHKVFLGLRVKVASEWQRDPKMLGRLGF